MCDQDRITHYNINTISSGKGMRMYQLGDYKLIQYQIVQASIIRIV